MLTARRIFNIREKKKKYCTFLSLLSLSHIHYDEDEDEEEEEEEKGFISSSKFQSTWLPLVSVQSLDSIQLKYTTNGELHPTVSHCMWFCIYILHSAFYILHVIVNQGKEVKGNDTKGSSHII